MPEPNTLPRLCVRQIRLPSLSAIENDVVWLSSVAETGSCGGVHCSVGPITGLPSRTRARSVSTWASDRISASFCGAGTPVAMRTPAARRTARSTVSTCSVELRFIFARSKPSRMRRVSRNWKPSQGGGGTWTVRPRYVTETGSRQVALAAIRSSMTMQPPSSVSRSRIFLPSAPP